MSSELDWACAKALGWIHSPRFLGDKNGYWITLDGTHYIDGDRPVFSADHAAARLLEDEIERRGIISDYLDNLTAIVGDHVLAPDDYENIWALYPRHTWRCRKPAPSWR
jgi:hypothetical protein